MTVAVCFHHVRPDAGAYATSPERFHHHLERLRREGFGFVDFDTFASARRTGRALPRRSVLLTTDDGYADNWYWAWPVLRDLGVPSVFFVITGRIGDGPMREAPTDPAVIRALSEDSSDAHFIRWSELRAIRDSGLVSVQSHTHRHESYEGADGDTHLRMLRDDIAASIERIETELGRAPRAIAWPWGRSSDRTRELANGLGLDLQFSVTPGRIGRWSSSRLMSRFCADELDTDALVRQVRRVAAPLAGDAYSILRIGYNLMRQARERRSLAAATPG
jgi:peptidoglycan/xylan/chitin deacetylase (PgdA/CDA1 family)